MPPMHRPGATSPRIGRMKRDRGGFSVRGTTAIYPSSTGVVAGRLTAGEAPRSSLDGDYWAGQLSSMAFSTASVFVPPLLTQSIHLGPERAGANGTGHQVRSVEADARGACSRCPDATASL